MCFSTFLRNNTYNFSMFKKGLALPTTMTPKDVLNAILKICQENLKNQKCFINQAGRLLFDSPINWNRFSEVLVFKQKLRRCLSKQMIYNTIDVVVVNIGFCFDHVFFTWEMINVENRYWFFKHFFRNNTFLVKLCLKM